MASYRILVLALACGGGVPLPALAQDDFQQWLTASAIVDLTDSVEVGNETVARFGDNRGGLYELENALMLGYRVAEKVTISAGYVHNPQYDAGRFTIMERRAREQIAFDHFATLGSLTFSGRVRFEQRWRDGVGAAAWRLRPQVKAALPLGGKSAPALLLSLEPFVNLNATSFQSSGGLERTRSAISLTVPIARAVKLEAGYLNQHRFVRDGPDTDDHAFTLLLGLSF